MAGELGLCPVYAPTRSSSAARSCSSRASTPGRCPVACSAPANRTEALKSAAGAPSRRHRRGRRKSDGPFLLAPFLVLHGCVSGVQDWNRVQCSAARSTFVPARLCIQPTLLRTPATLGSGHAPWPSLLDSPRAYDRDGGSGRPRWRGSCCRPSSELSVSVMRARALRRRQSGGASVARKRVATSHRPHRVGARHQATPPSAE